MRVLIGFAEKPKRSFRLSFVYVRQRLQLCNFAHNLLSQQKTMFKVSNRNTRKRCLLISKLTLKTSERSHLTTSYLLEVTVQNYILDNLQCQFAVKSLPSVLLSSSTACSVNNSRPIYVISWEMRNNYRIIRFMKNSKCHHFLFLNNQPQKGTNFSTFYLQRAAISVSES